MNTIKIIFEDGTVAKYQFNPSGLFLWNNRDEKKIKEIVIF